MPLMQDKNSLHAMQAMPTINMMTMHVQYPRYVCCYVLCVWFQCLDQTSAIRIHVTLEWTRSTVTQVKRDVGAMSRITFRMDSIVGQHKV